MKIVCVIIQLICRVRKWKILFAHYENKCQWKVPATVEKCVLLDGWQKEEETWQMVERNKWQRGKGRVSLSLSLYQQLRAPDGVWLLCVCACVCVCVFSCYTIHVYGATSIFTLHGRSLTEQMLDNSSRCKWKLKLLV